MSTQPLRVGDVQAWGAVCVSPGAHALYVPDAKLEEKDKQTYRVPKCCDGSAPFLLMSFLCVSVFIIAPIVLLNLRPYEVLAAGQTSTYLIVAIVLFGVGILYFCGGSSFRHFLRDAVCCKPPAPESTSVWSDAGAKKTITVKNITVIYNPHAGLKNGESNLEICKKVWDEAGVKYTAIATEYAGHARELANTLPLNNMDVLCVIGGDGSIHEVVNGLLGRKDEQIVPVGMLPGGSGNSIMCDMGTWDMGEAARRVASGTIGAMDVNIVSTLGERFASVNELTFGLVGDIGVIAENFRWMGPGRYNNVAMWGLLKGFKQRVSITCENDKGEEETTDGQYLTCFVNHTQHFGLRMRAAPDARVDDGLMDLCFVEAGTSTRGELLAILNNVPFGGHASSKNIQFKQVRACTLRFADGPGIMNADGEVLKHDGTISIRVLPRKLRVITDFDAIAGNV